MLVKPGDIFQLGEHRLACGDAKDRTLTGKLIGDNKVFLLLTDPPYGVSYVEGKADLTKIKKHSKVIANDHAQSEDSYREFTKGWMEALAPYLSPKNSFYIFNSDRMLFALRDGLKAAGYRFTQLLIWVKNHAVLGRLHYLPQHELIAYGWYGTHAFQKSQDKSVIFYPKPSKSLFHPTMKPVGLLRRLILNSSKIGDFVYDPFAGSGSTLLACEQTKRKCVLIELDPEYCQTIIARFEKLTEKKAIKL